MNSRRRKAVAGAGGGRGRTPQPAHAGRSPVLLKYGPTFGVGENSCVNPGSRYTAGFFPGRGFSGVGGRVAPVQLQTAVKLSTFRDPFSDAGIQIRVSFVGARPFSLAKRLVP